MRQIVIPTKVCGVDHAFNFMPADSTQHSSDYLVLENGFTVRIAVHMLGRKYFFSIECSLYLASLVGSPFILGTLRHLKGINEGVLDSKLESLSKNIELFANKTYNGRCAIMLGAIPSMNDTVLAVHALRYVAQQLEDNPKTIIGIDTWNRF